MGAYVAMVIFLLISIFVSCCIPQIPPSHHISSSSVNGSLNHHQTSQLSPEGTFSSVLFCTACLPSVSPIKPHTLVCYPLRTHVSPQKSTGTNTCLPRASRKNTRSARSLEMATSPWSRSVWRGRCDTFRQTGSVEVFSARLEVVCGGGAAVRLVTRLNEIYITCDHIPVREFKSWWQVLWRQKYPMD